MRTSIDIKGLETYAYHGLFDEEQRLGQRFTFDIRANLKPAGSHRDDALDGSVRYDALVDEAVRIATGTRFRTLEALGEAMAVGLLWSFEPITDIVVGVAKHSPPIAHTVRQVGVEIRLDRAELDPGPTAPDPAATGGPRG